jgi:hypothetical protein
LRLRFVAEMLKRSSAFVNNSAEAEFSAFLGEKLISKFMVYYFKLPRVGNIADS